MEVKPKEGEVLIGNARYKGFSKDLMNGIANILNFTYEFHLTSDGKYGNYDVSKKAWNGLIGDIWRKVGEFDFINNVLNTFFINILHSDVTQIFLMKIRSV